MPIARKPGSHTNENTLAADESAAEAFIAGANHVTEPTHKRKKIPVLTRFDPDLLDQVDAYVKKRGISRSAWMHFVISRALEQGEG